MGRILRRYPPERDFEVYLQGVLSERWNVVARSPWAAARAVLKGDGDCRDAEWHGKPQASVLVSKTRLYALPDEDSFEFNIGPYDYHLRWEPESDWWALDQFLTDEVVAARAHLNTETFPTLEEAVQYAEEDSR